MVQDCSFAALQAPCRTMTALRLSLVFATLPLLAQLGCADPGSGHGASPGTATASGAPSRESAEDSGSNADPSAGVPSGEASNEGLSPDLPLTPAPPTAPAGPAGARFLSDVCAAGEQNGWGPLERDLSNGEQALGDGGPLRIGGQLYAKGIGTHAPSSVGFALGGRCSRFTAVAGIDSEMKRAGSVRFQVLGDGQVLAQTDVLTGADAPQALDVDVSGVQQLQLVVDAGENNGSDHADWGDAQVVCAGELPACPSVSASLRPDVPVYDGFELEWQDEFEIDGAPNPQNWGFENGFVRNEEAQWYQPQNASVAAGFLVIEGRRERVPNPNYRAGSTDWKTSRQFAEYTSASLNTRGKQSFRFGRLELRARFPAYDGLWPAWWMLGNNGEWPSNGEVDILEFYKGSLHANFVVGTNTRYEGNWDAIATPLTSLGDGDWDARFHVYRMDWDDQRITLSVDGTELNTLQLSALRNPDGQTPFVNPAYTLLNLAIGGQAGGDPAAVPFPVHYEVDYVRVYSRSE
jgi:beta-glucanase (GH16 family)